MYRSFKYIQFLLKSFHLHGIHSPFVYKLKKECFKNSIQYTDYKVLKNHREFFLRSKETIQITDFGAGSRVFKTNEREVTKLAQHVGVSAKRQELLYRLIRYFKPKNILELGTSLGMATIAMSLANENAIINTVEGCPATSEIAQKGFDAFDLNNIHLHNESFIEYFRSNKTSTFDYVYIDGNHSKEATLKYFDILLQHTHENSVLIFDDIYWSKEMTQAWEEIYRHKAVTVSIDTFQWGFVFFRKKQPKQHFSIRV